MTRPATSSAVRPAPRSSGPALVATLGVLTAANLLNNRFAPRAFVPTSVAASIALLAIARRAGCGWAEIGLGRTAARRGGRRAAALVVAIGSGYAVAAALPRTRPLLADGRVAGLSPRVVLYRALVRVPCGTVALEEIGFRGVLFALLRRRYGTARASLLSAALFGLWHLLPARELPAANPALVAGLGGGGDGRDGAADGHREGGEVSRSRGGAADTLAGRVRTAMPVVGVMAVTASGGLVLGELRRRDRGLVTPMALHAALNGWGYVTAWAVTRRFSASPATASPGS